MSENGGWGFIFQQAYGLPTLNTHTVALPISTIPAPLTKDSNPPTPLLFVSPTPQHYTLLTSRFVSALSWLTCSVSGVSPLLYTRMRRSLSAVRAARGSMRVDEGSRARRTHPRSSRTCVWERGREEKGCVHGLDVHICACCVLNPSTHRLHTPLSTNNSQHKCMCVYASVWGLTSLDCRCSRAVRSRPVSLSVHLQHNGNTSQENIWSSR